MTELEELKAAADFARATYEAAQAAYEAAYDAADWAACDAARARLNELKKQETNT